MTKLVLSDLASLANQTTAISTINANNALIETAIDNTLSRDGTSPDTMLSDLDTNGYRILNLPTPMTANEPARLSDIAGLPGSTVNITASLPITTYTTVTPASGDFIAFADISDSNILKKATLLNTLNALSPTFTTATITTATLPTANITNGNITTAAITGGTATALTITTLTGTTANVTTVNATDIDCGASGTAGSLDVFPATSSTGKLHLLAASNAGNTTTTITNASQATTRSYTIPDAGADANFIMSKGATFGTMFKIPINSPVAGAGTTIADAAPVLTGFTVITGANGTVGWILPVTTGGDIVILKGTTAGVAKIWPQSGGVINALSSSAAMSLTSGAVPAILISTSSTQWYTLPLLPS